MNNEKFLLKHYISAYKFKLIGVIISLIFSSSSVLGIGYIVKYLVDNGIGDQNTYNLNKSLILLVMFAIFLGIATYLRATLTNQVCEGCIRNIRKDAYDALLKLTPLELQNIKISDINSRLTDDCTLLSSTLTFILSIGARNLIMFIGSVILLFLTSLKLTLIVAFIIPVAIALILLLTKKLRKNIESSEASNVELSDHLITSLESIKTIQAYAQEEYEKKYFQNILDKVFSSNDEKVKKRSGLVGSIIAIVFISVSIVLWIGGNDVLKGRISGGELSSFIYYAIVAASAIGAISEIMVDIGRVKVVIENIFGLLTVRSNVNEIFGEVTLNKNALNIINFENVSFKYEDDEQIILSDFSLKIKAGEKVALIGASGSGKSTIFNLLMRFNEPIKGSIYIYEENIKNIPLKQLRRYFSLVSQDPYIFEGSIYDNIAYGKMNASKDEINLAAKISGCDEFISKMPHGIYTIVGEKGYDLSGGEKQRISIARAFIKNADILLLDEATSALDSENEYIIKQAIRDLPKEKTCIIIAHRLSTVKNVEKIIVISEGGVEAIGNHSELLQTSQTYRRFIELQAF